MKYVISESDLDYITDKERFIELKLVIEKIRSHTLEQELQKERNRVIDIILDWLHTYYIPDVLKRMYQMRGN